MHPTSTTHWQQPEGLQTVLHAPTFETLSTIESVTGIVQRRRSLSKKQELVSLDEAMQPGVSLSVTNSV